MAKLYDDYILGTPIQPPYPKVTTISSCGDNNTSSFDDKVVRTYTKMDEISYEVNIIYGKIREAVSEDRYADAMEYVKQLTKLVITNPAIMNYDLLRNIEYLKNSIEWLMDN